MSAEIEKGTGRTIVTVTDAWGDKVIFKVEDGGMPVSVSLKMNPTRTVDNPHVLVEQEDFGRLLKVIKDELGSE